MSIKALDSHCRALEVRLIAILPVAAVLAGPAGEAHAQFFRVWTDPTGGSYDNPFNWNPSGVPGVDDGAGFGLDATYTVTFPSDQTTGGVTVSDGKVTFDNSPGGPLYTFTVPGTLTVDGTNNTTLTIETGTVEAAAVRIRNNGVLNLPDSTARLVTGPGTATIESGGQIRIFGETAGSSVGRFFVNGDLLIDGGTLDKVGRSATFSFSGENLIVQKGGNFILNGGFSFATAGATMTVDGAGSAFTHDGTTGANIGGESGDPVTLNVTGGGSFTADTGEFGDIEIRPTGQVNVTAGGTFTMVGPTDAQRLMFVRGALQIGDASGPGTVLLSNDVHIDGGSVTLVQGLLDADSKEISLHNGGTINMLGGTLRFLRFDGNLLNQGSTVIPSSSSLDFSASEVTSNYTQQAVGTLRIEVGGIIPTQTVGLGVLGNAILAGTLDVDLINSFIPVIGNSFTIVETALGNVAGAFDTLSFPVFNGLTFNVIYNPKSVVLEVIEVPAHPVDLDGDGDVDGDDLALLAACRTGPEIPYDSAALPAGCTLTPDAEGIIAADFNRDRDVDQRDFGTFQRCHAGPGNLPDPECIGES